MNRVEFKLAGPCGFLSNFFPYEIVDESGVVWSTSEHYYQAMKTLNMEERALIWAALDAREAKGLSKKITIRKNWNNIKENVMREALKMKFPVGGPLSQLLIETAPAELCEWAPWDEYWGMGAEGKGQNRLGILLMERRERLLISAPLIYL